MPSNAMKISQLVAHLLQVQTQHGDLDCVLGLAADAQLVAIDTRLIGVATQMPWGNLGHAVLTLGMWTDDRGQLTNKVGQPYQYEHTADEWNYSLDAAPFHLEGQEPVIVSVWRRDLAHTKDRGYKDAQGKWRVFEGGPRAWEIAPGGILAWKPE